MQGWRKRMEDSHITDIGCGNNKTSHLFGVFDGHGGKEVAIYVKRHFTKELLANPNYPKDIKTALKETFLKMDVMVQEKEGKKELKQESIKSKEEDEMTSQNKPATQMDLLRQLMDPKGQPDADIALYTGCTANVCSIYDNKMYFANAGDSRAVLCRKGEAFPMSIDHKPELQTELSRIEKAGGWVTEGRVKGKLKIFYFFRQLKPF